jgi:hypothetical protein
MRGEKNGRVLGILFAIAQNVAKLKLNSRFNTKSLTVLSPCEFALKPT